MPGVYLMSRKWSLTDRFTIAGEAGAPQFEVQGRFGLTQRLSVRDAAGAEVAVISQHGAFSSRYEIQAGGGLTTVRPRGVFGARFEINSPAGKMEARGNFSGRNYAVARGGTTVAAVSQQRTLRQRFAIEVADGEDPVLMLAVVLVIETIRAARQSAAASGGGM
jgi:uncharacterized protein YxjI